MKTNLITSNAAVIKDEVPSLIVPMANQQLLLPTVSVAEMLPFKAPRPPQPVEGIVLPLWYLGDVLWRGILVPMISYEAINGGDILEVKGVSQMAILNNTGVSVKLPFMSFPTQGIPRLSRVTDQTIVEDASQQRKAFDSMCVSVADEAAVIPDISKIERAYIDLMKL